MRYAGIHHGFPPKRPQSLEARYAPACAKVAQVMKPHGYRVEQLEKHLGW
jgi:hypothetical protein